ncbi:MAG: ROK family protein [Acidimicrobiia bacterium]
MSRYLGLDLGGTNIKSAIVDLSTDAIEVVTTATRPSAAADGPSSVVQQLIAAGQEMIEGHGKVEAVGVGVPGLFNFETGEVVFFTNLPGPWEGFPLRSELAEGIGLPTTLINDARAFTLAESRVGAAAGCQNVACITLGTGVGGGLFINGRLHFGAFGIGGEIGHQTLANDGYLCGCGNPGCLEAFTRPPAVAARANQESFEAVIAAAKRGDPEAQAALDDAIEYLGIGLANVVTLIGPERIVVGGGGAEAGQGFIDAVQESVRSRVTLVPRDKVTVVAATLGSTAGAVGAALAAAEPAASDTAFLTGTIPSATNRRKEATEPRP